MSNISVHLFQADIEAKDEALEAKDEELKKMKKTLEEMAEQLKLQQVKRTK